MEKNQNGHNDNFDITGNTAYIVIIVRRAGLLWSQQDFEWLWSVPLSSASLY